MGIHSLHLFLIWYYNYFTLRWYSLLLHVYFTSTSRLPDLLSLRLARTTPYHTLQSAIPVLD